MSDTRPDIGSIRSGLELKRWYWRKDELVAQARELGLSTNANKFALLERVAHFLDTGEKSVPGETTPKAKSKFDWHKEPLCDQTLITDSYKNTQNVRRFFKSRLGESFKFNIAFMEWMRANVGKPLSDAVEAYQEGIAQSQQPGYSTAIKDHNQFNQYTRDFLAENPTMGMQDVRRIWALKIQRPSSDGRHRYSPDDLKLEQT